MYTANSADELLEAAYSTLDFHRGELLCVNDSPDTLSLEQWVDKADWLALAKKVGAEKIFFVKDNPVVIFARTETQESETARTLFNQIWCMARPQHLFLAMPGKLAVYDLTKPPAKNDEEWNQKQPLALVERVAEVAQALKHYHRSVIESGKLPEEEHFGDNQRADQALIKDLETVRNRLISPHPKARPKFRPLSPKYAHALIGRSIFIRYLEDRGILDEEYFSAVAAHRSEWQVILNTPLEKIDIDPIMQERLYARVLRDKDFTYALFEQLCNDFNGDMFPSDLVEKKAVDIEHLELLQKFLIGDLDPQQKLFFWAYKFDIIPIELISSIYEEFYAEDQGESDNKGTHYTPSSLVRLLLAQVLTPECLEKKPRILDPCCGSGIFLVEAFRRIVRYRVYKKKGKRLSSTELTTIIRDQLAGIEINEEAIRITAFSLYLAMLHFSEPPSIREQIRRGYKLPSLIYQEDSNAELKFNNLITANAFDIAASVQDEAVIRRFERNCVDVIIGNPPWGSGKENARDQALEVALAWCKQRQYPVGDREKSQAFIWRTLDLLKDGGYAGLLVSNGIFFKHRTDSQKFRQQWLTSVRLIEVINFSHVRKVFFQNAISPFASVVFQKTAQVNLQTQIVNYFSAKETAQSLKLKSLVLNYIDLQRIPQIDLLEDDRLWKICWWGNHRDHALIRRLEIYPLLKDLCILTGAGFEQKKKDLKPSNRIRNYKALKSRGLGRYGALDREQFEEVPESVGRFGKTTDLYEGKRILVKRGISESRANHSSPGQIIARFESERFSFRHSIFGIKLAEPEDWKYKVVLGILWSSLTRYYLFMISSTWGRWHHEIHLAELLKLPICLPHHQEQIDRLIQIVDRLRKLKPPSGEKRATKSNTPLFQQTELDLGIWSKSPGINSEGHFNSFAQLEHELDEAVFDLYGLRAPERDQIRDMCDVGIELLYNSVESEAAKSLKINTSTQSYGVLQDITESPTGLPEILRDYLTVFLKLWNSEIYPEGEFSWQIVPSNIENTMICIIFSTQNLNQRPHNNLSDSATWSAALNLLDNSLLIPYNSNKHIYIDGIVRAVTDTHIIIIKRNEMRLWTRSMAREDAEATLLQAMNLQSSEQGVYA